MTKEELAAKLNGREYQEEMTKAEEDQAAKDGLIVMFGYSDDNVEVRGAAYDEIGAYDGTTIYFDADGLIENDCDDDECPYFERLLKLAKTVDAIWARDVIAWQYETTIPHSCFDIMEDEDLFCRGIVFHMEDLK